MLPSVNRLRLDNDIKRVLKSKAGAFDPICGVKMVKNGLEVSRFAVVVPNKVTKSAVKRNAIRRQYREIIRLWLGEIVAGFDVILLASKPAMELSYEEKKAKLRSSFVRARLL